MSSGTQISDIVLPPEIKDDFQVRDISSQFQSQTSLQTSVVRAGNNIHTGTATVRPWRHISDEMRYQYAQYLRLIAAVIKWDSPHAGSR